MDELSVSGWYHEKMARYIILGLAGGVAVHAAFVTMPIDGQAAAIEAVGGFILWFIWAVMFYTDPETGTDD